MKGAFTGGEYAECFERGDAAHVAPRRHLTATTVPRTGVAEGRSSAIVLCDAFEQNPSHSARNPAEVNRAYA